MPSRSRESLFGEESSGSVDLDSLTLSEGLEAWEEDHRDREEGEQRDEATASGGGGGRWPVSLVETLV